MRFLRLSQALTLVAGLLAAGACEWARGPSAAPPPREERAVYSAALHRVFTEDSLVAAVQVVRTTTDRGTHSGPRSLACATSTHGRSRA